MCLLAVARELPTRGAKHLLEQVLRKDAQQDPSDAQGGLDVAVLIGALRQDILHESYQIL